MKIIFLKRFIIIKRYYFHLKNSDFVPNICLFFLRYISIVLLLGSGVS